MIDTTEHESIIKQLGDYKSRVRSLSDLYNNKLLDAEGDRSLLSACYEQMVDFKNDLASITTNLAKLDKSTRAEETSKNQAKVNRIEKESNSTRSQFVEFTKKYRTALQECGSLKTEYKHEISELCKKFNSIKTEETPKSITKSYATQVSGIKHFFGIIERLIASYNVNRNKIEQDSENFNNIYNSVHDLVVRLQTA